MIICQIDIKSLVFDLSSLQLSIPFMLTPIAFDYFATLTQIIAEPKQFTCGKRAGCLKYSMLALKRYIKEFTFYSDDGLFMTAINSKPKSANYLDLRKRCHQAYFNCLSAETVSGLLNHLLANVLGSFGSKSEQQMCFDVDESMLVDRSQQRELPVESCAVLLIESVLERFPELGLTLISQMVLTVHASTVSTSTNSLDNYNNLSPLVLGNLLGVLALLPRAAGKKAGSSLANIPILQILQLCYSNQGYRQRIPSLISGWLDYFNNDQLVSLVNILLEFIMNQDNGKDALVLHCCQALDKVLTLKKHILALPQIVKQVVPVATGIFQKNEHPEFLWPMVHLLSGIITQCDFDSQLLLDCFGSSNNSFSTLVSNQSPILVQALSDMFCSFLCVLPRKCQAQTIYQLICLFLQNHLSQTSQVTSEKVLHLWYMLLREYSPQQNCQDQLVQLYQVRFALDSLKNHYKSNLFYKTPTLIYILQEYMLLGLIQADLQEMGSLLFQFYLQAGDIENKTDKQALKIAALSFQITLATQYNLQQINSEEMLSQILRDFYCFDLQQVSATVHNSLLAIVNRYIILHKEDFLSFLSSNGVELRQFYNIYFNNMQYLTSQSAKKINAIASLTLMSSLPQQILVQKLHPILITIIPSIQSYLSTLQQTGSQQLGSSSPLIFSGKVVNSPSLRFASNFLSQRKEHIRKKGLFENVDLLGLFKKELLEVCQKTGANSHMIAQNFPESGWDSRLLALLNS